MDDRQALGRLERADCEGNGLVPSERSPLLPGGRELGVVDL